MLTLVLVSLGFSIGLFLPGWVVSLLAKRAVVVDALWGFAGAALAGLAFFVGTGDPARRWLLLIVVALWGVRLGLYLTYRVIRHSAEDRRYAELHSNSGKPFWLFSLTTVFGLQAVILWFNMLPVTVAVQASGPAGLTWLDYTGAGVWMVGFLFQVIGDWQLASFKAKPENSGRILDSGLWRYTRHPNYFGEAVMWWGVYLVAAATEPGRWMILSPLLMTWLLLKVSGVAMADRFMAKDKGDAFSVYKRRTNAFLPWFPKE